MPIKKTLKENKYTGFFIRKIRNIQYIYLPFFIYIGAFNIKRFLRVTHLHKNNPYKKLRRLKNKHKDERCFIVATGPSLIINDLEKIGDEITISMNTICLAFKDTKWRPTYYGIQDEFVYQKMQKYIEELDVDCKFISDTILKKFNFEILNNQYIFPLHMLHHTMPNNKNYNTKFSANAPAAIYSGHTITYSLIQIAVYMGFKEIYLLGADCHYGDNTKHHFRDYDIVDPAFGIAGQRMMTAYKVAKKYADKHNIKIYNATRGGMLEVFERVDLDEVLNDKKKQISAL
jgi:hypothetical protein